MRAPIRSESDAFRLTIGVVLVLVVSVLMGALIDPFVGLAVFVIALALGLIAFLVAARSDHRHTLREAADEPHPHGAVRGKRHVLVVANQTLAGSDLMGRITHGNAAQVEIDVLAPVLCSRMHLGTTDIDRELADARARLERSLAWARNHGLDARGEVGDPSATTALADELRDFGADEVIVVTHPHDQESWQERVELERLRDELDVPVTHFVIGEDRASQAP
jgi:GABA permease